MNETIICPTCKTEYQNPIETCTKCNFPFSGSEKEKSIFIGQQLVKKSQVSGTKDKIKRARNILWIIAGANTILPFLKGGDEGEILIGFVIGVIFAAFGFLTYKKPFISILIPLLLLLISYVLLALIDPYFVFRGIIWKVIFVGGLSYALIGIIEANKIKKESDFLKEQKF